MTILNEKFDYININLASPEKIKKLGGKTSKRDYFSWSNRKNRYY